MMAYALDLNWLFGGADGIDRGTVQKHSDLDEYPDEVFHEAYDYIVIIFWGIPVTILYNTLSGIIRSLGDSKTPLYFLVFSSLLNVALDLLLFWCSHGVAGAAWATVISQLFRAYYACCLWQSASRSCT